MKTLLTTSIAIILMGATQTVYAAALKPPSLNKPQKGDTFPIKKDITFSWLKTANATQYRLIISSSSNFDNYKPAGSGQCLTISTTKKCFVTTTKSTSFKLPKNNPLLQVAGSYYWQVQAVSTNSGNNSVVYLGSNAAKSGEFRQFFVNDAPPNFINESVLATPNIAAVGSAITFDASLTTELPSGYAVNIEIDGGEVKKMKGSGVDYSYTTTFDTEGEDRNFTVSIVDASGNVINTNGDSFTITPAGGVPLVEPDEPVIETPPVIVKPVEPVVKPVTVPSVSTINVSPASIVQGDSLTFSANLSDVLPSGYSVKVDYGNGLFAMNGSGKNYSFNAAPAVSAAYSIGVYDAKNLLKGTKQTGNFSVSAPKPANVAPTLSLISGDKTATVGVPYTIKLSANDSDNNLSAILVSNWGDGASDSPQTATNGATLSFSHTFTTAGSYTFNATAYDSADANSNAVTQKVTVSKPVVAPPATTTKTTGYTKIANNGSALSDDAKLGTAPTDWACTKDNKTGLIWEVKTDDGGLRDLNKNYTWDDSFSFATNVNTQGLCGAKDWRLPTNEELRGLVMCSDGKYNDLQLDIICSTNWGITQPTIKTTYFPNTKSGWFWSSSPDASGDSGGVWFVDFGNGYSNTYGKDGSSYVRLVR
jgi:hypothetical protein